MSSERFKCFNGDELLYLYRALSAFIDAGNGIGFHNCDRGHPDYSQEPQGWKRALLTLMMRLRTLCSNWGMSCTMNVYGARRRSSVTTRRQSSFRHLTTGSPSAKLL